MNEIQAITIQNNYLVVESNILKYLLKLFVLPFSVMQIQKEICPFTMPCTKFNEDS